MEIKNKIMQITGFEFRKVYQWAKDKLENYLRDDFPEFWEDSLKQFMDDVDFKLTEVSRTN